MISVVPAPACHPEPRRGEGSSKTKIKSVGISSAGGFLCDFINFLVKKQSPLPQKTQFFYLCIFETKEY